ncbi:portal protein [Vibrio phage 13VV501A]|nr:portal protein [Vibrio phage 13VV501A]
MADENNQFEPIAVPGYDRSGWGGKVDVLDEYLPELRGRKGRRTIRQMTNDETIGAMRFGIDAFFRGVEAFVDAPKSDDIDQDTAEQYRLWLENTLFNDLGDPSNRYQCLTWDDFVLNALTCLDFGWSYFDVPVYKKADGTIGISDLMLVAQETLDGWELDESQRYVTGLYQRTPAGMSAPWDRYIPRTRALHFVASPYKSSPEGRSAFRHIYRPWYYKQKLMAIEAILAERGCGFPVVYVDASVKNRADAGDADAKRICEFYESLAANIKTNSQSGAVIYSSPYRNQTSDGDVSWASMRSVELKLETPGQSNSGDIDRAIKRYDAAITRGMLATFLMLGTDGKGGSLSLGQDQSNLFLKAITGWLEMIYSVVNKQLVPMLWELNGFPDEYRPYVRPGDLTTKTIEQVAAFVRDLAAAGIMLTDPETEDYLRDFGGLPARPDDGMGELAPIPVDDEGAV